MLKTLQDFTDKFKDDLALKLRADGEGAVDLAMKANESVEQALKEKFGDKYESLLADSRQYDFRDMDNDPNDIRDYNRSRSKFLESARLKLAKGEFGRADAHVMEVAIELVGQDLGEKRMSIKKTTPLLLETSAYMSRGKKDIVKITDRVVKTYSAIDGRPEQASTKAYRDAEERDKSYAAERRQDKKNQKRVAEERKAKFRDIIKNN